MGNILGTVAVKKRLIYILVVLHSENVNMYQKSRQHTEMFQNKEMSLFHEHGADFFFILLIKKEKAEHSDQSAALLLVFSFQSKITWIGSLQMLISCCIYIL